MMVFDFLKQDAHPTQKPIDVIILKNLKGLSFHIYFKYDYKLKRINFVLEKGNQNMLLWSIQCVHCVTWTLLPVVE